MNGFGQQLATTRFRWSVDVESEISTGEVPG